MFRSYVFLNIRVAVETYLTSLRADQKDYLEEIEQAVQSAYGKDEDFFGILWP